MLANSVAPLDSVLNAAEQGVTIITANTRSARAILQAYDHRQSARGVAAWRTPDVLSWGGFLLRMWNEALYSGLTGNITLLNSSQEQRLWESIVETDAREMLNPVATAQNAQASWELAKEYGVPIGGASYELSTETQAFAIWAAKLESECKTNTWASSAILPDLLIPLVQAGRLSARKLMLVGFDDFTPQQNAMLSALADAGAQCESGQIEATRTVMLCRITTPDSNDEIRAAATWARERLEANSSASIAVLVPSLQNLRAHIESVFLATLHPDQLLAESSVRNRAFEISLGIPLSDTPIVAAALLMLKLCIGTVSLAEAGVILTSPYISGSKSEMTKRAQLDVQLRKNRILEVNARGLMERASGGCAVLADVLRSALGPIDDVIQRLSPRKWTEIATIILEMLGWPDGERALSSDEYQAVQSWTEMLSEFGSLETIEPMMDGRRFLMALNECATRKLFEPEKSGAPIQIIGLLEAAGSTFDHMWIMGLHDGAWPMRASVTPFIPATLQLKYSLPHSSPQKEFEFSQRVHERLLRSASEIVMSCPQKLGDAELRPSPLLDGVPDKKLDDLIGNSPESWGELLFGSCECEILEDKQGPSIAAGTLVKGGTKILEQQSACPFRAFAELRLGALKMDSPQPGLDGLQRGNIVHNAMEFVWRRLKTHNALVMCKKLREVVTEAVEQAIEAARAGGTADWERTLADIERGRVTELILKFLEIEKTRAPFTVTAEEQKKVVPVGGLKMDIRMDRIDHLADGRQVLIDYKTGDVSTQTWEGDRPEAPQVPAYAAITDGEIAAVAFGQIKAGSIGFCGYSPDSAALNTGDYSKSAPGAAGKQLNEVIADWKYVVEQLASDHREGRAEVNPADPPETCKYCPLPAMCRYTELQLLDQENADEE